jgi:hypothetical protein
MEMVDSTKAGSLDERRLSHLVVYGAGDGSRQYLTASGLNEAIVQAEFLVNERDNDSARIFELREVTIEYRHYYRVEVSPNDEPGERSASIPPPRPSGRITQVLALPA